MKTLLVNLYEYFYKQFYENREYVFKPTANSDKLIVNFIKLLETQYGLESIGFNFFWFYFQYSFLFWIDAHNYLKFGRITPSNIFGSKPFVRFVNRNYSFDNKVISDALEMIGDISKSEFLSIYDHIDIDIIVLEDIVKKRYFNSIRGFYECIENTTLYNSKSKYCILCKFNVDCKKLRQTNCS